MKILIAEDDLNILEGLIDIFESEGFQTVSAQDGLAALKLFNREQPDFVCLDIMMPGKNGYDVCRDIRKQGADVPVIFISAKSEEIDKVLGLELGADDYIIKPFGVREVVARIRAVTRRYLLSKKQVDTPKSFFMNDLEIFPAELRARRDAQTIELSLRDIEILKTLFMYQGKVVHRNIFFQNVWGFENMPLSRTLDQHISQLRKKIEQDPKHPKLIKTVHGIGYRFDELSS